MDNFLDTILRLHALGYSMIPSGGGPDGKSPLVAWTPYQEKQPSELQVRRWYRSRSFKAKLWGIVTGKVSGVIVVDCDPGADRSIMEGLHPHVKTPRGGWHYYFQHPGHPVKTCTSILPKIDIRGDGGFANVIGANPKTNAFYTLQVMLAPDVLNPWEKMPKQIIEAMEGGPSAKSDDKRGADRALDGVPEGERDTALYKYACRLVGQGMSKSEATVLIKEAASRCDPPFPEKEALAKVESAFKHEREAPQVISARTLAEHDFPELRFAIPDLMPEGLTLLAGKPKVGKSWLVLQFAYSVALGKNLLDGSKIEKGGALVLALEDGKRRLQTRIRKLNAADCVVKVIREEGGIFVRGDLGGDIPEGLDLAVAWPRIGSGGIEHLERYLDEHPDTRLVVVDIIKRMIKRKGKGAAYDEDYDSVEPLQKLATKRRIAILGVHHVRKALSDDPMEMVSGTFGLTGGVDSIMVLRGEGAREFRLSVSGRDIEAKELAIGFKDSCAWELLGDADEYFVSEARMDILGCIENEAMPPSTIASITGRNRSTVKNLLRKMLMDGQVTKDSRGRYSAL